MELDGRREHVFVSDFTQALEFTKKVGELAEDGGMACASE